MNKLYNLSVTTHKLVQKLAKREGIEVVIESEYWYSLDGQAWNVDFELTPWKEDYRTTYCPVIQADQIRQILKAFEGILGVNPKYQEDRYESYCDNIHGMWGHFEREVTFVGQPKTQAEALCQRWLDGLNPMIDSEPEKVLEELNEALQSKLT